MATSRIRHLVIAEAILRKELFRRGERLDHEVKSRWDGNENVAPGPSFGVAHMTVAPLDRRSLSEFRKDRLLSAMTPKREEGQVRIL
jgi:hypothetical protein